MKRSELGALAGEWKGKMRLCLAPGEPERRSETTAWIEPAARGRFLAVRYAWHEDGPQEGLLLVALEDAGDFAWIDSWHMGGKLMLLRGEAGDKIEARGSYPAPPGPDWGWRIALHPDGDVLRIVMHNITPEGQEAFAVEADYARA